MKLNKAEREWLAEMQHLLDTCPSKRLGFYTIGDAAVALYDRRKEEEIGELQNRGKDFSFAVYEADAEIEKWKGYLTFPALVHSVSG